MFEGTMVLLQPWLLCLAFGFIPALLTTYVYKRNLKNGLAKISEN